MAASKHSMRCGSGTRVAMRASARPRTTICQRSRPNVVTAATMKALIFDCDGVILESEELHRLAYNASFNNFDVRCPGQPGVVDWTEEFYEMLQNKVGGGKPKMRWYFGQHGWPTTSILGGRAPTNQVEETQVIDQLQDWKTNKYKDMIGSGEVDPRPGVLRLMDEARAAGIKVAVCSAATKSSVVFTLPALLGQKRFTELDCFLAGDDVPKLKPDPTIYLTAATKMGVDPSECVVVEDSIVGLKAAVGAGMRCIITYTPTTKAQTFAGAERVVSSLGFPNNVTIEELAEARIAQDDRISFTIPT